MSRGTGTRKGGCLCGAVRFRAHGRPLNIAHCHCGRCRKATGAAFATFADYRRHRVVVSGTTLRVFSSSPGARRLFCGACGTSIAYKGDNRADEIHLHVGAFDAPETLVPRSRENPGQRLEWIRSAGL